MTKHTDSTEEKPLGARARMIASMTPEQIEALSHEERTSLGLPAKEAPAEPEPASRPPRGRRA